MAMLKRGNNSVGEDHRYIFMSHHEDGVGQWDFSKRQLLAIVTLCIAIIGSGLFITTDYLTKVLYQTNENGKKLEPKVGHGLQAMSIGLLVEEDTPMIWRGPMVTQALEQLLTDTNWEDVDFLIIDLPPGTGDVQLTLCQKIPLSGAVIVTTPQDISLIDARKGLKMFEKVEVPVLGVVENMSTFICPKCGTTESIFGEGGGEQLATENDVKLLGELPLQKSIREEMDKGTPTVSENPESPTSMAYREIARKMAATLSMRKKDYSSAFPKIVIQND